ncbi:hypothetical protein, conserved [Leishmania tarentolae]|uniref:Uncharacterized protein n=1 Tax=Leishmania tarentolae TaxID=5689 RepID=A0A640KHL2_LEITA|nr:hypothetical protein, conserved [Leishmania tarentolae]
MSLLRVTQFLTADGKVHIDVTNTSGRTPYPPPQSQPAPRQPSSSEGRPAEDILDRDEPCSLIVSLRSSHPHFFYYRGPPHKQPSPSTSVASQHLYAPPPEIPASAGVVDVWKNTSKHQRGSSSLWCSRVVDPVIEDVSRQAWRDLGFSPVAAPAAGAANASDAASSVLGNGSNGSGGDDRPLLVREELADCVLLPGERRTFLLEVDTPSVLQRLMEPLVRRTTQVASAPSLRGNSSVQDSCPGKALRGSTALLSDHSRSTGNKPRQRSAHVHSKEDDTDTPLSKSMLPSPEVSHLSRHGSSSTAGKPSATFFPATSRTTAKVPKSSLGGRQQQQQQKQVHSKRGKGPLQSSGSRNSDESGDCDIRSYNSAAKPHKAPRPRGQQTHPLGMGGKGDGKGKAADQAAHRNDGRHRRQDRERSMKATDYDARSLSPQPLSIVKETGTSESLETSCLSVVTSSSAHRPWPSDGTTPDSRRANRDLAGPTLSTTAVSTPGGGATHRHDDGDGNEAANRTHGNNDGTPHWLTPASTSRRPTFYIYYAPLGDENKCVDRARKWLLKEQHAYRLWLDKLVRLVIDLERQREQGWIQTSDHAVRSPHRPLGTRRVLPPILGELVRWRADGGGSDAVLDVMAPSPITAATFQHYYGSLPLQKSRHQPPSQLSVRGNNMAHSLASVSSKVGSGHEKEAIMVLPPSFAATRRNRVSAKAQKMFKEERHGAGTVVLPLRVKPQSTTEPSLTCLVGNIGTARSATAAHRKSPSSSQASDETRNLSRKSARPPYSRVWTATTSSSQLRPYRVTSPQQHTMENSSELGDYRSISPLACESPFTERGYEHPHFKSGCGLALLEDSAATLPTVSRNSFPDGVSALPSQTDNSATLMDSKQNFYDPNSFKINRTETLDPVAAEMAAADLPTSRWLSFNSICNYMHRVPSDTLLQQRRQLLPSFSSTGDMASPDSQILGSSSSAKALGTASTFQSTTRMSCNNSPPPSNAAPGYTRTADDSSAVSSTVTALGGSESASGILKKFTQAETQGTVTDGALTATAPAGSFASQLIQSFCGYGGSAKCEVDEEVNSAYRFPNSTVSSNNSFTERLFSSSFPMHSQERLNRMADQSIAAGSQVKVAVQQLTSVMSDLLQQHGPPAMSGFMSLLDFLKDTVFTPTNVNLMQMVVTPMVMTFSVLVIVYLIFCNDDGSDVFSLVDGRGL